MKYALFLISLLSSWFLPLAAKVESTKDAEHYSEEIIIDDRDQDSFDLDDFADERRDDQPPQSKELSVIKKLTILWRIIAHATADWYHEHMQPTVVEYWHAMLGCIKIGKHYEQKQPKA